MDGWMDESLKIEEAHPDNMLIVVDFGYMLQLNA